MGEGPALPGRRALVTASSRGIGREIGLALARCGADVVFNYRTHEDAGQSAAAAARALGVRAWALGADCADAAQVRALVAAAIEAMGGLEILINNVGEFSFKRLRRHSAAEFERIIAGTVGATFHATMAALPELRAGDYGRVVNLGAAGAETAMGGKREGPHMAGKAAVISLTRSFALEEASGSLTFNAVCPGIIEHRETPRAEVLDIKDKDNPVGRPGTGEDIVDAVLFLCRPSSSFINGAAIPVTGGWQGNLG